VLSWKSVPAGEAQIDDADQHRSAALDPACQHRPAGQPRSQLALSTQDAEAVWEVLGQWVQEVLGDWCEVTRDQLPDCWALHRPALQVSWLWTSHIEAYQPHSRAHAAAEWHTRWLDAALEKIKRVIPASQCHAMAGQQGEHGVPVRVVSPAANESRV
jgi:hypothetical protein